MTTDRTNKPTVKSMPAVSPPTLSQKAPLITRIPDLPKIAFVEARWYRRLPRRNRPIWLIIHATHGSEGTKSAEACARMFATIPSKAEGGEPRSSHLVCDADSAVQCVPFENEAWHAGGHGNKLGEGLEICGRADQTLEQWCDDTSLKTLAIAACLVRWRCESNNIPMKFVDHLALRANEPGITTHAEITLAFPEDTTHTDPGEHFPLQEFLNAVRA